MTVIAVSNFHFRTTVTQAVKLLMKAINGWFEVLNFGGKGGSTKTCYVKLSDKLDPQQVIRNIKQRTRFGAFLPSSVPNLVPAKRGKLPMKIRQKRGANEDSPEQVLIGTHLEILTEMQSKYSGLFNLSKKTGFKLLEGLAQTIFERLKVIMDTNPEGSDNCFKLSKSYRKLHPHFGDFQLILSTLHRLQDAAGVPRAQISETDLMTNTTHPYVIENIPYDKVEATCNKYSDRIIKKVSEHIQNLKCDLNEGRSDEDVARKRVREELKRISPYLPLIIKQVISRHFIPEKSPYHRIRIYGEPFLPSKEQMILFLKRYGAMKVSRDTRMSNMLKCVVPPNQSVSLLSMDGTVVGGAKLVIRSSDIPLYKPSTKLINDMKAAFGTKVPSNQTMEVDTVNS